MNSFWLQKITEAQPYQPSSQRHILVDILVQNMPAITELAETILVWLQRNRIGVVSYCHIPREKTR